MNACLRSEPGRRPNKCWASASFFRAAESGSAQTRRLRSQDRISIMHSAMSLGCLMGAALDIAAAAAEHPARRMDEHQTEAVRGVRAPIVVRPEPHVSVIVRFLS